MHSIVNSMHITCKMKLLDTLSETLCTSRRRAIHHSEMHASATQNDNFCEPLLKFANFTKEL